MNYRELSSGSLPKRDGSYTVLHQRNMPAVKHVSSLLLGIMGKLLLSNRRSQVPLINLLDAMPLTTLISFSKTRRRLIGSSELTGAAGLASYTLWLGRYYKVPESLASSRSRGTAVSQTFSCSCIRPARTFCKCRNDGIGSELPLKGYPGPCLVGRSWR